jgi:hypothetical protein
MGLLIGGENGGGRFGLHRDGLDVIGVVVV